MWPGQPIGQLEAPGPPTSGRGPRPSNGPQCAGAWKGWRLRSVVSAASLKRAEFGTFHWPSQPFNPCGEGGVAGEGFGFCEHARNQEIREL